MREKERHSERDRRETHAGCMTAFRCGVARVSPRRVLRCYTLLLRRHEGEERHERDEYGDYGWW